MFKKYEYLISLVGKSYNQPTFTKHFLVIDHPIVRSDLLRIENDLNEKDEYHRSWTILSFSHLRTVEGNFLYHVKYNRHSLGGVVPETKDLILDHKITEETKLQDLEEFKNQIATEDDYGFTTYEITSYVISKIEMFTYVVKYERNCAGHMTQDTKIFTLDHEISSKTLEKDYAYFEKTIRKNVNDPLSSYTILSHTLVK